MYLGWRLCPIPLAGHMPTHCALHCSIRPSDGAQRNDSAEGHITSTEQWEGGCVYEWTILKGHNPLLCWCYCFLGWRQWERTEDRKELGGLKGQVVPQSKRDIESIGC